MKVVDCSHLSSAAPSSSSSSSSSNQVQQSALQLENGPTAQLGRQGDLLGKGVIYVHTARLVVLQVNVAAEESEPLLLVDQLLA